MAVHPAPLTAKPPIVSHRAVLAAAIPISLVAMSTPLVGLVDTAVIGHLGNPAYIGGIAAASIIVNFVFFALNLLRTSTTALVAHANGAGDSVEALAMPLRAVGLAALVGVLTVALQWPIAHLGFDLLGLSGPVREAGLEYLVIRIWSTPLTLVNYAIVGWLFGQGNVMAAVALQVQLNLVNVALALLFVVGLGWGVSGAAWATVVAEVAAAGAGLTIFAHALRTTLQKVLSAVPDLKRLRQMLAVNLDILLRSLILFAVIALFTRQGAQFGDTVLAANVILVNFFYLTGAVLDGLATASQQLAGRSVGARSPGHLAQTVRIVLMWAGAVAAVLTLVYLLGGRVLAGAMTSSEPVQTTLTLYFNWILLVPVAGAVAFVMDGLYIGAGWTRELRNLMLLSAAGFLGLAYALVPAFHNHGLWAALVAFLVLRSGSAAAYLPRLLARTQRSDKGALDQTQAPDAP